MATFAGAVRERIGKIVEGTQASGRGVPTNTFHARQFALLLTDGEYPSIEYERAYELHFLGMIPHPFPEGRNPRSGRVHERSRWSLSVGYLHGYEGAVSPSATPGDSDMQRAEDRAFSDWPRIREALEWPANWGTLSNGMALESIRQTGEATMDTIDEVRSVLRVEIEVLLSYDPATVWDLGT